MLIDENLEQIELPAILKKLSEMVASKYGQVHFDALEILYDRDVIEEKLCEIEEMVGMITAGYHIPIGEIHDIRPLLEKLKPKNAFLEIEEINQVKLNLNAFEEITRFLSSHEKSCRHIYTFARRIHPHKSVVRAIEQIINPHGEIREDASPELRKIKIEIHKLENEQKTILTKVIKRYTDFSQDDIVTLRDGRMVLGIQQQFTNKVNGIVHGTSSSGATVFIEPMETLRLSNQIQNLKIKEKQEIIRLLQSLSSMIRDITLDIFYSIENYGYLDFIYAKAKLSIQMQAASPKITEEPILYLKDAYHPLLLLKIGRQNVVPYELTLGKDFKTLVITGPNAGGKTVTLKTIGLLLLMTQIGLQIPADPDSMIPIIDQIFVDIGDRQSLEQDLSTFSAHILRLQEILQKANTHSLVLIDEIGTGTDPKEGAALAVAILQKLTHQETITVATTHHGELKAFAFQEENVENASMDFNLDNLRPTYKLKVGVPGSSYAFEIARRFNFSESVLKEAEKLVGSEKSQLEKLLLKLNKQIQEMEKERRQLNIRLSEVTGITELYKNQLQSLKKEKSELRKNAAKEAERIINSARSDIENVIAEIRRSQAKKEEIQNAHQKVNQLRKQINNILHETEETATPPSQLQKGDIVWVNDLKKEGEILSETKSEQKVWVGVNDLRIKLDISNLKKLEKNNIESDQHYKKTNVQSKKIKPGLLPELDLRGMDSYQAIENTNIYLDKALAEGWQEIRIIHGKGMGVLRKSINQYLGKDKRVLTKRLGKWGEGDTGVTIVTLRY